MPADRPHDMRVRKQPVWLNPLAVWLPLPGWLSIVQRMSGLVLALIMPLLVALVQFSLSPRAHELVAWSHGYTGRFVLAGLMGLLVQHALGGVRFLLLEKGVGTDLKHARWLSGSVFGLALLAGLIVFMGGI